MNQEKASKAPFPPLLLLRPHLTQILPSLPPLPRPRLFYPSVLPLLLMPFLPRFLLPPLHLPHHFLPPPSCRRLHRTRHPAARATAAAAVARRPTRKFAAVQRRREGRRW